MTSPPVAPALTGAQPLREVLATPALEGVVVLAGHAGLDRHVERLNVMEVPDIASWVKARELLLTTAYPLRGRLDTLPELIAELDDAGVAGLAVKLGRYLDALPAGMLEAADARGFPVVRLPDHVSFDDVLNEVLTSILNRQAQRLARSEEIHRAFLQLVLAGHGLPEIVADLADLLGSPAAIVDPDGRVVAHARLDELGLSPAPDRLALDLPGGDAEVDGDRRLGCVAVPISAGPVAHGHVVALSAGGAARTDDLLALENAATVAALALTKQREVQAIEDKYRAELMHDLLRRVEDRDDVLRRASSFGWDLDRRLICAVVRLDAPPEDADGTARRPQLTPAIRARVLDRDPGAALVRFSQEVVLLTGAFDGPHGRAASCRFAADLAGATSASVSVGVSRPVDDVHDVAGAYDQASRAVAVGRRIHGCGAATHFDDLGAYRILSLVEDHTELRSFAEEVLGELAADAPGAVDLRRTLEALLETGGNVAEAARRLHFHYNTLRYRVDKLEAIVGPFTSDARVRLDVQLALLVLAMRGLDDRR